MTEASGSATWSSKGPTWEASSSSRSVRVAASTFATIRHRTVRAKGCLSNKTALAMIFKLAQAAEKSWRRLDGHHHLPKVIRGITFTNGIEDVSRDAQPAAAWPPASP